MYSGGRYTAGFAATLLALLFAFTLRALIPGGYMPDAGGDSFHLVICGPAAPAGTGGGSDDEGPTGSEPVCVFAAASPVAGPADPPPLPRPVVRAIVRESASTLRDPPTVDRSEGPPPPARAPPLSI
ncbi:MAG: hypothetical protein Q8R45_06685 [Brevundimonas sp.]|uniref:hypothetical protein n=1 Tax=Brevundimonas sp. TaxID=1871086 RepID=UPI00271B5950|nr:hypothetical protein [Brevundimonas sp.]MDO9587921.1 hypothetical protein [Brevundimonas sp.]MDP3656632.1 hypothetical protein [Brevundimonas sp.]MDZ4110800.1 hypothetical protein [Brevundimonas sp.]